MVCTHTMMNWSVTTGWMSQMILLVIFHPTIQRRYDILHRENKILINAVQKYRNTVFTCFYAVQQILPQCILIVVLKHKCFYILVTRIKARKFIFFMQNICLPVLFIYLFILLGKIWLGHVFCEIHPDWPNFYFSLKRTLTIYMFFLFCFV